MLTSGVEDTIERSIGLSHQRLIQPFTWPKSRTHRSGIITSIGLPTETLDLITASSAFTSDPASETSRSKRSIYASNSFCHPPSDSDGAVSGITLGGTSYKNCKIRPSS